ncbi:aminoglycoside phosphotransferase [Catenovulum agarivorans DS-2]|uniref:Aminoglycoside phosphotransferase n=1 Tax=Catenovulum agarivorans DS-2 TaxID=1328313 RepID=W7QJI0_9ALTE|nr:phosphotransferase [Catenovulum agarivorans]EWH09107.1 aminoglycoside phosphotransferase [Catenovulum agarivorans DS-2]
MPQLLQRQQQLNQWLEQHFKRSVQLTLICGDASFRRYFRFSDSGQSYIAVDAPPEHENNPLFVEISQLLTQQQINTVDVIQHDFGNGFMLLKDLGNEHLIDRLNEGNFTQQYSQLFALIAKIQTLPAEHLQLKAYDQTFCLAEMALFNDWYLQQYHKITLSEELQQRLTAALMLISEHFLQQPQVFIHRDLHCKNIMLHNGHAHVIDFQGMMYGPCTYDLASLLKDCYLNWPTEQINDLAEQFRMAYHPDIPAVTWQTWFDIAGLQRHIKCLGIFCRLSLRDNKPAYLQYLPRVLDYVQDVCVRYQHYIPQLAAILECLELTQEQQSCKR